MWRSWNSRVNFSQGDAHFKRIGLLGFRTSWRMRRPTRISHRLPHDCEFMSISRPLRVLSLRNSLRPGAIFTRRFGMRKAKEHWTVKRRASPQNCGRKIRFVCVILGSEWLTKAYGRGCKTFLVSPSSSVLCRQGVRRYASLVHLPPA